MLQSLLLTTHLGIALDCKMVIRLQYSRKLASNYFDNVHSGCGCTLLEPIVGICLLTAQILVFMR